MSFLYARTNLHRLRSAFILLLFTVATFVIPSALADDYWYVDVAHLNVRDDQLWHGQVIAILNQDARVTLLSDVDGKWKQIQLQDGTVGYVNGDYLTNDEPTVERATAPYYSVKVNNAYVRGDDYKFIIAVLRKNDVLEILEPEVINGTWFHVRVRDTETGQYIDREGYVGKNIIEPATGYSPDNTQQDSSTQDMTTTPAPLVDTTTAPTPIVPLNNTTAPAIPLNSAPAQPTQKSVDMTNPNTVDMSTGSVLDNILSADTGATNTGTTTPAPSAPSTSTPAPAPSTPVTTPVSATSTGTSSQEDLLNSLLGN